MTNQEKKKWLMRYRQSNQAINQRFEDLEKIRSLCEKITSTISDMLKNHCASTKDNIYVQMMALTERLMDEIKTMVDIREEIEAAINSVDDMTLQSLLRYRYINGFTWEKIAVEMNYAWRNVHYLHRKALYAIQP